MVETDSRNSENCYAAFSSLCCKAEKIFDFSDMEPRHRTIRWLQLNRKIIHRCVISCQSELSKQLLSSSSYLPTRVLEAWCERVAQSCPFRSPVSTDVKFFMLWSWTYTSRLSIWSNTALTARFKLAFNVHISRNHSGYGLPHKDRQ